MGLNVDEMKTVYLKGIVHLLCVRVLRTTCGCTLLWYPVARWRRHFCTTKLCRKQLETNSMWNVNKFNNGLSTQFRVTEFKRFMNFIFAVSYCNLNGFTLVWIINCVLTAQLIVRCFATASWFRKSSPVHSTDVVGQLTSRSWLLNKQICGYAFLNTCLSYWNNMYLRPSSRWNLDIAGQSLGF